MVLNHINLTVSNAQETAEFLQRYFGLTPMEGAPFSAAFALLRDENGMILTLMRASRDHEPVYPASFHIDFAQPSEEQVNEINQRLRDDGHDVPAPARLHGSWTFYFTAPGNFTIEVLA